jgi:hypothetical protein
MCKEVWRWCKETGVKRNSALTVNEKGKIENKAHCSGFGSVRAFKEKVTSAVF